nr:uncharacterized protein LOC121468271 [Taeniopygia guttata]
MENSWWDQGLRRILEPRERRILDSWGTPKSKFPWKTPGGIKDKLIFWDLGDSRVLVGSKIQISLENSWWDQGLRRILDSREAPASKFPWKTPGGIKDEAIFLGFGRVPKSWWAPKSKFPWKTPGGNKDEVIFLGFGRIPESWWAPKSKFPWKTPGGIKDKVIFWDLGESQSPGGLQNPNFHGKLLVGSRIEKNFGVWEASASKFPWKTQDRGGFVGFGRTSDSWWAPKSKFPWKTPGGIKDKLIFWDLGESQSPGGLQNPNFLGKLLVGSRIEKNFGVWEAPASKFPWKTQDRGGFVGFGRTSDSWWAPKSKFPWKTPGGSRIEKNFGFQGGSTLDFSLETSRFCGKPSEQNSH